MEKSRVRVMQTGEEHEIGLYEDECIGSYVKSCVCVFLQWSHVSSLPVSSTMMTGCGGDPTVSLTVRVTLWLNESFLGGPGAICWILRGKIETLDESEEIDRIYNEKIKNSLERRW